jgi:hypothetical protein
MAWFGHDIHWYQSVVGYWCFTETMISNTDLIGDKDVLLISSITETVRRHTFSNAI